MSKSRRRKKRIGLFTRIMLALVTPLLFLIVFFSAIQLAAEMKNMNQRYQLKSSFAFESVHRTLQLSLQQSDQLSPEKLAQRAQEIQALHEGMKINIYDILERQLLFQNGSEWAPFDENSLESALYEHQQGKRYIARINKESNRRLYPS